MRLIVCFIAVAFILSCNNSKSPDVSGIKIDLTVNRFEQDLFTIDTASFASHLDQVIRKYPLFGENFVTTILNADPRWSADSVSAYVKAFVVAYKKVYDSSQAVFADFDPHEKQIRKSLQYLHHYFPAYKYPRNIITYIGPLDGYGDILAEDALIVGLHHHLGKDFSLYKSEIVNETYPSYISQRFEPEYIPVNCMKNIINDMYPEKLEDRSLVEQMVEKGKRLYLLNILLPEKKEHLLIGYSEKQLAESYDHEKQIWNLFIQNNMLQVKDQNLNANYIGESPKTSELGEASPGNIGSFAGWQIVKKYMSEKNLKPEELMAKDASVVYEEAKYKP